MSKKKYQSYAMPEEVMWVSENEEQGRAWTTLDASDIKDAPPASLETALSAPTMPYAIWFAKALKRKKVKFYQEEPLLVFFRKQGLSKNETEDAYFKMLQKY